ncbi:MAG: RICIN domain-containing protein [Oscillospiraceae bacterium]
MKNKNLLFTIIIASVFTINGIFSNMTVVTNADENPTPSLVDIKNYIFNPHEEVNLYYDVNYDNNINVLDIINMKQSIINGEVTIEPIQPTEPITTTDTTTSINGDIYVTPFVSGQICTIQNVGSGKYLNVDYGIDANGTNVYQWTGDGSTEQKFNMDFLSDSSCYRIRTMCSDNGQNRTLDIVKSNGNVVAGANVEIYDPVDDINQEWLFVNISENTYKIVPKYNTDLALTSNGNSNGSADGTLPTSSGNVFVDAYTGDENQQWIITIIDNISTTTSTTTTVPITTTTNLPITTTPIPTTTAPPITTTTPTPTTTTTPITTTTSTPATTNSPIFNLPDRAYIENVTPIVQSGLPTGCEATGLTILLNWYGFNVSKEDMAMTYMPRQDFYYADGKKIGPDYITTFAGDPSRKSNSYGCYIPCMMSTVQNYFDAIGRTDCSTTNLTGTNLDDLFPYIAQGTPVAVITTNNLITPTTGDSWYTSDGRYITWQKGHHCMIIIGYDLSKNEVYVSESAYSYVRTYNMDTFRNIYNLKGKNAMIVNVGNSSVTTPSTTSTQNNDTYVTPFSSGDICTFKNVASGKYLNVDYGLDTNGTNVYQWTGDGSTEQQFKMDFISNLSCYRIRTMCSSNGENRVLDIVKSNGNVVSGGNVEIYNPVDDTAQQWLFVKISDNVYKIVPKYNTSLALSSYGNTNGSADGTASTSSGNVFVSTYTGSTSQQWIITKIN